MAVEFDWGDEARPALQRILGPLGRAILLTLWRLRVAGLEHIPRSGGVLVACNHISNADPPVLGWTVFPVRSLRYLAKMELFQVPLLGWFLREVAGAIPVDRRRADVAAVRTALELLARGRCLLVFPEGTRSKDGLPGRPKSGVGFLAGRSGVPVVPARVLNTNRFLLFARLEVRFGAPLRFSGDPSDRRQCQAFSELVMRRVFSL